MDNLISSIKKSGKNLAQGSLRYWNNPLTVNEIRDLLEEENEVRQMEVLIRPSVLCLIYRAFAVYWRCVLL